MKKYEYKFVSYQGSDSLPERQTKLLNALGAQGWMSVWHGYEPRNGHSGWWFVREVPESDSVNQSKGKVK